MDKLKETLLELKADIFGNIKLVDNYYKLLYIIMQSAEIEDKEYQYFLKENINDLIKFYKNNYKKIESDNLKITFYDMMTHNADEGKKLYCTIPSSVKHSLDKLKRYEHISWSDI